jgi:hypothetical protein
MESTWMEMEMQTRAQNDFFSFYTDTMYKQ